MNISKIIEKIFEQLMPLVFTAITVVFSYLFPKDLISKFNPVVLFWIIVCLVVLCGVQLIHILKNRAKYTFNPSMSVWKDKEGIYYCPRCMAEKKISGLGELKDRWHCYVCGFFRYKPGMKPKPEPLKEQKGNSWLNRPTRW